MTNDDNKFAKFVATGVAVWILVWLTLTGLGIWALVEFILWLGRH